MTKVICPKCGGNEATSVEDMCDLMDISNEVQKQWMCDSCQHFFDGKAEHWYDNQDLSELTLSQLADIIMEDWGDSVSRSAYPYVTAMMEIETMADSYGSDSARSIVAYFLSNAEGWESEIAGRVKEEFKLRLEK
ncbi:MAG: hypothetical protein H6780_00265 [Candidatus Nomurabacteria bacterium]|nr:MAG: hypothetical protein H6780_00265 [Candidatus Nomurabacteria bacterium]